MCGISGLLSFERSAFAGSDLHAMTNLIRHRGPDDEGFMFVDGNDVQIAAGRDTPPEVLTSSLHYAPHYTNIELQRFDLGLGHRRLSIVDVSAAGHQPMCTKDRRYWIVYNGEVYNFIELRSELKELGHVFGSHSDTEVILAAYQAWGNDCLSRFNGMFAFLLYDFEKRVMFVARDRFGVKPLYYWVSENGIAFASEIKQFTVLPGWQAWVNGQRAYDFLNWAITDHTDETLFDGVFQFRGGQALELNLTNMAIYAKQIGARLPVYDWYSLRPQPFEGDFFQAAAGLSDRLRDAVSLRLRADVPIGSCLSGGLDSSSIVGLMSQLLREQKADAQQKTFSACSDVSRFDEREFIDEVVRKTGVEAHYVYPKSEELFATHEQITWYQDEPYGSTSIYAQWHVFKLAAEQGVKVMLDGQGADEQLAGYHSFFAPHYAGLLKRGRWIKLWSEISAAKRLHGYSEWTAVKGMSNMLLPEWLRQRLRARAGKATDRPNWLAMSRLGAVPVDPFISLGSKSTSIRKFSYGQLTASNLQMLLHWEDRDSMAHSIESRVPFLDYHLVEYVLGLPDEFKLKDGITKRVLREGMRGILPERISQRMDKLGFVTPEEVWLRERAPEQFRSALKESIAASRGILNERASTCLEEMIAGKRAFSFLAWRMISFGAWMKQFNVMVKG